MTEMVVVRAILATTEPMDSYGGVRIPPEQLRTFQVELRLKRIPMNINHDPSQPMDVEIIDSGIELLDSGEEALWVEYRGLLMVWLTSNLWGFTSRKDGINGASLST